MFDEKDQEHRCEKVTKQFNRKMHGILGSVWPKINLPPFLKVKEEIFYVYCLYCVGFLDLFAVSCLIPLLTHRARELGASPSLVGLIGSVYGGLQLFSSPIMGKLSDVFGRKQLLLVSLLGTAMGYYMTSLPTSLLFLALSRIPAGIFKHSQSVAKTYLADISEPVDHPKVFGNFNAFSNLGFVIGPLIGGHLAMQSNGFFKVAYVAATIFIVNFFFVWFFVKQVEEITAYHTHNSRQEIVLNRGDAEETENKRDDRLTDRESVQDNLGNVSNGDAKRTTEEVSSISKLASVSSIMDLLVLRFLMGFSMLVFRSNFMSMLEFHFNTSPKTNGYIMSYNALIGGFSGILMGSIADFYNHNDSKMLLHFSCLITVSILGITFSPSIYFVAAFITPLAVSSAVSRVCLTNLTFRRSRKDEKGVILGVGNSLLSLARMISPALGGFVQEISAYAPGSIGATIAATGVLIMILYPTDRYLTKAEREKKND